MSDSANRYHRAMKQMITRVDDELHARLRMRAAQEGRSLNDLVTEVLVQALERRAGGDRVRERARLAGLLYDPPPPDTQPALTDVVAATHGAGRAFSDALDDVRRGR